MQALLPRITVPTIVGEFFKVAPKLWFSNHFLQITYSIRPS